jgi:cytidine deaminase
VQIYYFFLRNKDVFGILVIFALICVHRNIFQMESKLIELAKLATRTSYSPYSNFKVGAAVLMSDGNIFTGSNQENAAYSACLCAERVALLYACANANDSYPVSMAIAAFKDGDFTEEIITPCGECCQVLVEMEKRFSHNITIYLYGKNETKTIKSAKELLPLAFKLSTPKL